MRRSALVTMGPYVHLALTLPRQVGESGRKMFQSPHQRQRKRSIPVAIQCYLPLTSIRNVEARAKGQLLLSLYEGVHYSFHCAWLDRHGYRRICAYLWYYPSCCFPIPQSSFAFQYPVWNCFIEWIDLVLRNLFQSTPTTIPTYGGVGYVQRRLRTYPDVLI